MRKGLIFLSIAAIISLGGCGNITNEPSANLNHSDMNNSSEVPKGLKEAKNPTYPIGTLATIQADHMPGMKGAEATIIGAYDTTAYSVSYTPTTGAQPVNNHKWVIQEEIKNADNVSLTPGIEVILEADHMPGMKGATGKIDSAENTTMYMVDYTSTTDGETVKNHKWLSESELSLK